MQSKQPKPNVCNKCNKAKDEREFLGHSWCRSCRRSPIVLSSLQGSRIGKLHILRRTKHNTWLCQCDCNTQIIVSQIDLVSGAVNACSRCSNKSDKSIIFDNVEPLCPKGHSLTVWGVTKSGRCRACMKESRLLKQYGITIDDFIALWVAQAGRCAICSAPLVIGEDRIEVDHAHVRGSKRKLVRGLLCGGRWFGCNRRLGKVDDPMWLYRALHYVADPPASRVL